MLNQKDLDKEEEDTLKRNLEYAINCSNKEDLDLLSNTLVSKLLALEAKDAAIALWKKHPSSVKQVHK